MAFNKLDPLLHSELRLAIISILISVQSAEFVFLREKTNSTAGNLSVQIDKLEKAKYIKVKKSFKAKRPLTTCSITSSGIIAFELYIKNLKDYLNPNKHNIY